LRAQSVPRSQLRASKERSTGDSGAGRRRRTGWAEEGKVAVRAEACPISKPRGNSLYSESSKKARHAWLAPGPSQGGKPPSLRGPKAKHQNPSKQRAAALIREAGCPLQISRRLSCKFN